ncbi:MAG: hemin uptake protein HemP [Planctomycetota bacterium]
MSGATEETPQPNTGQVSSPDTRPPEVDFEDLSKGARLVHIHHDGETYRLMRTRNNRLILQK